MTEQKKLDLKLMPEFKRFSDRIREERAERLKNAKNPCKFGIAYLDECLSGIYANDLIVVGASSGLGKTEIAVHFAITNVLLGKRVHFFALEAEAQEIERRIKYKLIADIFYNVIRRYSNKSIDYADWYSGKIDEDVAPYEAEVDEMLRETYPTLTTIYRNHGDYTIQDFEKQLLAIQDETDLIIIDHLHYFDSDEQNENKAVKEIVKKIRDLALQLGKAIVLISHVRKKDRRWKQLVPSLEDFHGSSDIGKIATKAITLAPCRSGASDKTKFPTFISVVKNRTGSSRTRCLALTTFDVTKNKYSEEYYLGVETNESEFEAFKSTAQIPHWATSAKIYGQV